MKKKVLSILLALVMVFSLIPTTMWAEEGNVAKIGDMEYATLAEAIAAANDGDTVTLLADVTLSATLEIKKSITLDLNENTLSKSLASTSDTTPVIKALSGTVEIKNGEITYDIATYTGTTGTSYANVINVGMNMSNGIYSGGDCDLTLNGVDVSVTFPKGKSLSMIYVGSGKLNVINSNLSATNVSGNTSAQHLIYTTAHASAKVNPYVSISGSTTLDTNSSAGIHAIWLQGSNDTLIISGNDVAISADATWKTASWSSTYSYAYAVNNQSGATCTIEGGKFLGKVWQTKGTIDVSGGYFSYAQGTTSGQKNKITLAEGYEYLENTDSATMATYPYVVAVPVSYVAQIGDVKYETLKAAIEAVPTNDAETTITMLADEAMELNATLTVAAGKNIVLDLNGHTVTGSADTKEFYFLTNNGTLEITDSSVGANGKITASTSNPDTGYSKENVTIYNLGGTLTLTAGTVENTTAGYRLSYAINNSSNAWGVSVISTFNMTGGAVSAPQGDAALRVYQNTGVNWKVYSKNYVNISGGIIPDNGIFIDTVLYTKGQNVEGLTADDITKSCVIDTEINISGGTINGLIDLKIRHPFSTELNITGGDFTNAKMRVRKWANEYGNETSAGTLAEPTEPIVKIDGGKFSFVDAASMFNVSTSWTETSSWSTYTTPYKVTGGKFNYEPTFVADGYEAVANTDDDADAYPHVIGDAKTYVAQIGDVKYETLEAAVAAAKDGETVIVLADCAGNGIKVPQGKFTTGLTVNFNGHTYTMDGAMVGSTGTETQAFQLLKDNTITFQNGTITSAKAKILVQNYSNLTLDGMTLTLNNPNYASAYTLSNNNGNVVIDGSTINANPAGGYAFDVCRYSSYPSVHVTVQGESVINGDVEISASGSDAKDGFGLTLTSGTLTGNIVLAGSAVTAMEATPEKATVTKADAFTQTAPAGYKWSDNGNGTSSLVKVNYVAQIGDVKYETLEAAVAAAKDGETVIVLADCAGNGIKVPQGKFTTGLTVNFNSHTYTMDGAMVGSTGTETQAFQLLKDNKITFQNGTITSTKAKILVQNYSNLTLEGMTLTLDNPNYTSAYTLSNNNGNVVIDGSTINANPAGGFAFDVCRYSSYPSVRVTVQGNSTINGNVEISASGSDAKDGFGLTLTSGTLTGNIVLAGSAVTAMEATPEKATVTKADAFTQAAPAGYKWSDNGNGTSSLVKVNYVAQIGNTKYETLEAAIAAAKDGETVTVLADCSGNGIKVPQGKFTTGLTVNFNSHTYTMDGAMVGSTGTETQAFQLLRDNKITFQNGTITSTKAKILVQNYSNLTLEGMTLTLDNPNYTSAYTLSNNNGNVVIDGSTINANPAGGFAFDVCRYASYPSVRVTVQGASVINGNVEISASKSDAKDGFGLTLTSGALTGNIVLDGTAKAALENDPTKASVTKADAFTQTAPAGYKWNANGDGTSSLVKVNYVAQIGDAKYETLEEAIAAAQNGDTVTLLSNVTLTGTQKIAKNLTIDGNNKTVTAPEGNAAGEVYYVFYVVDEGGSAISVTLKDMTLNTTGYQVAVMANGDYNSTVNVNNVDINTDGAAIYANGHMTVQATGCDIVRSGMYTTGKDNAYYSALNVGYGGTLEATDCDITVNGGNGAASFPSGGTFTLTNVNITVAQDDGSSLAAGYALWSRNEDYTNYPDYCMDSVINVTSGTINGDLFLTDKYPAGDAKNVYEPKISATGGTFDHDPTAYVATGYEAVEVTPGTWQVGEVKTTAVAAQETVAQNYEATYSASKKVVDENNETLASETPVTVNLKTVNNEVSTGNVLNKQYDVSTIVAAIVEAEGAKAPTLNVSISVVKDNPEVVVENNKKTVTYEVHPVATITNEAGDTLGTYTISNDQLAGGATFVIKLPVPMELRTSSGRVKVTHKLSDGSTVVYGSLAYDENGFITIADVAEFSEFELEIAETVTASASYGFTLALKNKIEIPLYVYNLTDEAYNYFVEYRYTDADGLEVYNTVCLSDYSIGNGWYRFVVAEFSARQMSDEVYVRLYNNGTGENIYNGYYSIKQYCEYMIGGGTQTESLIKLCKAALDYGKAAQLYFDYNLSSPIADSYNFLNSGVTIGSEHASSLSSYLFDFVGATVSLKSQVQVNFYFQGGYGDYTFEVNGEQVQPLEQGGYYVVSVSGITAKDLGKPVTVTVTSYGEEETFSYSPLAYAYYIQGNSQNNELIDVCKAMYLYWSAANDYLN